jgi:hypothetical protein
MLSRAASSLLLLMALRLFAGEDPSYDFSGKWTLDAKQSDLRGYPAAAPSLTITQQGALIRCAERDAAGKAGAAWSFRIDGAESTYRVNNSSMSSLTKWEGSALLVNILVSGAENYAIMDRWKLSPDRATLTIHRQFQRATSETEVVLVYRNAERAAVLPKSSPPPAALVAPAQPHAPIEIVIEEGTKIPLALINTLNTKYTNPGDRVYLETVFPVAQGGRIVIPRGSYVSGTVTEVKRAGRVKGKAELFLRFDSLTLPNGVTRDFRSRLDNADAGNVDREEGKIDGDSNKGGDAKKVGATTAAGAGVGGIAGAAAGHAGMGVGVGAAGGAAAGLAGVLLSRGPDLVLPKGTTFEMVLDRMLRFKSSDLEFR